MRWATLLLPTLDEEGALPMVLEAIPWSELEEAGWGVHILVVDGGSEDDTVEIAKRGGCTVLLQMAERGKGSGMRQAFSRFLESGDDALVMIDADGTYDPRDIIRLLDKLEHSEVVLGSRLRGRIEPGAMSRTNYIGNHLLSWMATLLYGQLATDLCTGAWAFRRESIEKMNLNSVRFEIEAEMFATCAKAGMALGHVPISYRRRIGDPKLGSVRDGASILRKLIVRRFLATRATQS